MPKNSAKPSDTPSESHEEAANPNGTAEAHATSGTAKKKKAPAKSKSDADADSSDTFMPASTGDILGSSRRPRPGTVDPATLKPFLRKQQLRLLNLRDAILDAMMGVAKDNLRSRAEGSEASAFGMHQADAGSDAYDRDFALNLLSQEQDALYEIDEALKRVDQGTYGTCEMSGKPIPHARLEAIPFARYTVECQADLERQMRGQRVRRPVTSLFGLTDEEGGEGEDDDSSMDSKD